MIWTAQFQNTSVSDRLRVGVVVAIAPLLLTSCSFNANNKSPLANEAKDAVVEETTSNTKGSANVEASVEKVMPSPTIVYGAMARLNVCLKQWGSHVQTQTKVVSSSAVSDGRCFDHSMLRR